MNKKFSVIFLAVLALFSTNLFAKDYKWSDVWCTYAADLKTGDVIINADAGLHANMFKKQALTISRLDWLFPYSEASFDVMSQIWKLPFSFGGYAGFGMSQFTELNYGLRLGKVFGYAKINNTASVGTTMKYHFHLPAESLDIYAGVKFGVQYLYQTYDIVYAKFNKSNWDFELYPVVGFNWLFAKNFGLNVEFGGQEWVKAGLSFCFR